MAEYSKMQSSMRRGSYREQEQGVGRSIINWLRGLFRESADTLKNREKRVDAPLLGLILLLVSVGLVMLYSASYAYASYYDGDSAHYIKKQLLFAALGIFIMFLFSLPDAQRWASATLLALLTSYFLLVVVLVIKLYYHRQIERWINLGFVQFQPSEITKFAIILFCAYWASTHAQKMKTFKYGILPFMIVLGSTAALLILEPHLSGTILVVLIGGTLMWVGGIDFKWFLGFISVGVVGVVALIGSEAFGYQLDRITVWRDPYTDLYGTGWQNIQALYAIASGGVFGQGFGNSRQKYLYISEPQNDFIYAVICEELGFIGAVLIIALFVAFVWRGFIISMSNPSRFQKLLGIGITAQVGWQTLLNVAVVTKTIPNTGISLPFFSAGGTSLVMLLAEMGILLAISRNSSVKRS